MFGTQPTLLTVFHVRTDTLLLRVTVLLLRVTASITPCNSHITPSLGPPRLGPTVRSRTTEYPKWSSTIQTPDSIQINRMLLLRSNSFPPPSKEKGWVGGRNYGNSRRLIFNFSGSFALDHVVHWSAEVARFPLEIAVLVEVCENDLVCELSSLFYQLYKYWTHIQYIVTPAQPAQA